MNIDFDFDYDKYADENDLWRLLELSKQDYQKKINTKIVHKVNYAVTDGITEAYPIELDDLIRIHYLIRSLRVITALEIGAGKSTVVMADAIAKNKKEFKGFVQGILRKNNAFELHSVETSKHWASEVKKIIPDHLKGFCNIHFTKVRMDTFDSRICTTFDNFPNICPDFIYLDGPDQHIPYGDINGISTTHEDRMPMVSDILRIEHFLLPGTVILVDGRTANARFMKSNLQRDWEYKHYPEYDIHIFKNIESALGVYNQREINFKYKK